jgi:hypothetical protein
MRARERSGPDLPRRRLITQRLLMLLAYSLMHDDPYQGPRLHSALLEGILMKRPLGVTVLAVVLFLYGLLMTALGLFALGLSALHYTGNIPAEWDVVIGKLSVLDILQVGAQTTLGIFALMSGMGMFWMRPWAWLMGMLLLGCELAIQLGSYFEGHPSYVSMLITALLVFYLNQRPMREAFNIEPKALSTSANIHVESVGSPTAPESSNVQKP